MSEQETAISILSLIAILIISFMAVRAYYPPYFMRKSGVKPDAFNTPWYIWAILDFKWRDLNRPGD
jgi:hypothetical protein